MRFFHLRQFLRALLFLLIVTFLGKAAFALYHRELYAALSLPQQAHALLWGLRFDLAVAAAFALLAYLPSHLAQRLLRLSLPGPLRWFTLAAALLLIGLHGADTLYYSEAGRHLGYELKEGANSAAELARMALFSYTVTLLAFVAAMAIAAFAGWRLLGSGAAPLRPVLWWQYPAPEGQLLLILLLAGLAVRGGWQAVPMEPLHAQQIGNAQQATLALNGVYNALFSSITPYSIRPVISAAPTAEQLAIVRRMYAGYEAQPLPRPEQPYNVVILLLESWSAAWMASYGHDQVTTPFFDELRGQSLTTHGMLAGGHRTTEGMFATLCSAQNPLGQTVAQNQLQNYSYRCLPHVLHDEGYSSAFFQGTRKNTSGTGAFAQLLGFADSYGWEELRERPLRYAENSWGMHDPDIYDFALEKMRALPQPFLIGINTNTTHDSQIPAGATPAFGADTAVNRYLSNLHFADAALRDFHSAVTAKFGPTLFVILADHAGLPSNRVFSNMLIPFAIQGPAVPAVTLPGYHSQRDVAPTVLHLLGLPMPAGYTGLSLLGTDVPAYADYFEHGSLGWVEGNRLISRDIRSAACTACSLQQQACATRVPCTGADAEQAERALAFTTVVQNLLFEGKINSFSPH
jgi:phosphoglycerol transferase MdoB-like AlkP superfamily enzyme